MTAIIESSQNQTFIGDTKIYMIWDLDEKKNNSLPWFNAIDVARSLGYGEKNIDGAIEKLVIDEDKKTFRELKHFATERPKNMEPNAIFVNEYGLYSLALGSRLKKAMKVQRWLAREVIPAIRKTGIYKLRKEDKKKMDDLNKKLRELRKENNALKNIQKDKNYNNRGLLYILKPINDKRYNKIEYTHNTSVPNDMKLLYEFEVDDTMAMEHCMKSKMTRIIYKGKKGYYEISLKKVKEIIHECKSFLKNNNRGSTRKEMRSVTSNNDDDNDDDEYDDDMIVYVDISHLNPQSGGSDDIDLLDESDDDNSFIDDIDNIEYDNYHEHNKIITIESGIEFDFYSNEEMIKFSSDIIRDRLNKMNDYPVLHYHANDRQSSQSIKKLNQLHEGSARNDESQLRENFNYFYGESQENESQHQDDHDRESLNDESQFQNNYSGGSRNDKSQFQDNYSGGSRNDKSQRRKDFDNYMKCPENASRLQKDFDNVYKWTLQNNKI